jgi:hypothetical protein
MARWSSAGTVLFAAVFGSTHGRAAVWASPADPSCPHTKLASTLAAEPLRELLDGGRQSSRVEQEARADADLLPGADGHRGRAGPAKRARPARPHRLGYIPSWPARSPVGTVSRRAAVAPNTRRRMSMGHREMNFPRLSSAAPQ